ncbi:amyloid-beta A4 precursor protein-binding family B member 2 isoform X2 [Clupea harengus]|uniref:Amyloid-beta A4 precursor protein-binding family B member 2 isoform X2 n=1 Tax=Clupea harengus TaxID=7950 RepID=A0A6P8GWC8_CLUHA|nr:amyloid-beta A4 precursor protein-binding family B member 2 isoform X2 [Clupea harengus]
MMSLQKPPLTRSGSTPSTLDATNRSGPSIAPPTSLNLRTSHNQSLAHETIKEGVMTTDANSPSSTLPKSRQKNSTACVHNTVGATDNLPNCAPGRGGRSAPPKSASSTSLGSMSSISLSRSNSKLAKNGTNLQLKAEEEQHDFNKNQRPSNMVRRSSSDWLDRKDNQNCAPMRRRTKSFLDYRREEPPICFNEKQEKEEEEDGEEEKEEETEKPLLPKLDQQDWVKENWVETHLTLPQNHLLLAKEEEEESPTQAQLKGMEGSYSYDHKPKKEQLSRGKDARVELHPNNQTALRSRVGALSARQEEEEEEEDEDGEEDSSWTTLSQESPSMETPQEAGGVWMDGDLPPGWREVEDLAEVYFWHVPSGTTQRERPVSNGNTNPEPDTAQEGLEAAGLTIPPNNSQSERPSSIVSDSSVEPVPSSAASSPSNSPLSYDIMMPTVGFLNNNYLSIREEVTHQDANLRQPETGSAHVKLRARVLPDSVPSPRTSIDLDSQVFPVCSLGWLEVSDADMVTGRSSVVVSDCIRQLQLRTRERDTTGETEEGKPMLLVLQDVTLTLVDPTDHTLLHSQPISCIRVWGVGRDHSRDFAYVARDKNTRVLKCHVFRCDAPAEAIATSLHRICSKIMAERKNTKAVAGSSSNSSTDVPLQEFPIPKTELEQKFHVLYLGTTTVIRPIGMDMINGAIDTLLSSTGKEDWTPAILNVEDATVNVIKEKEEEEEVLVECRVRFLSFMGVGRDVHSFAFIMDTGNQHFQCHVFWCEPNAACVSEAVQSACVLRYQKCLVAQSPSQRDGSSSPPPPGSVTRRVTTSVKRGVQSLIDTLKQKKPTPELPHQ